MSFRMYADDHDGQFPFATNGYGNALLCLSNEVNSYWACLTGPGYDGKVFAAAAQTGGRIPESKCGRVYVQGLSITNNPEIALLFDKIPTPGGDHCHLLRRLSAPLTREVVMLDGGNRSIRETEWAAFAKQQIELLVNAGVTRQQAELYYSEKPTR